MASLYNLIMWAYYAAHARTPPDPTRYVLARSDWLPSGATVLDYGGDDGRWAVKLAARAAVVVVAEIDEQILRKAPAQPRLRRVLLDGLKLPFRSGVFDPVFVNHVLHHVEHLSGLAVELRRVVRPRGRLVVIEFHPGVSVTRIYRLFSHYRTHPCTFYAPHTLARLLAGREFAAEEHTLDDFQYVLVASPAGGGRRPRVSPGTL